MLQDVSQHPWPLSLDSSDTYPSLELKKPKMSPDIAQGPGDGVAEYQVTLIENHRCKVRLER